MASPCTFQEGRLLGAVGYAGIAAPREREFQAHCRILVVSANIRSVLDASLYLMAAIGEIFSSPVRFWACFFTFFFFLT